MGTGLVIGVDAGGTGTRAAVADPTGRVVGLGESGPGNPGDVGGRGVSEAIAGAVSGAFAAAGIPRTGVDAVFLGVAGVATESERAVVRGVAERLALAPPGRIAVDHDLRAAHAGALGGGPGMVLIVGTGSCCYGRDAEGREQRAGGWGFRLDDGGSAADLGRRALVAAIRESDGRGARTCLTRAVLDALGAASLREVLPMLERGGETRCVLAGLAPAVTAAAHGGDEAARSIIERGAGELALMVRAVRDGLCSGSPGASLPLAMVGGVLRAGDVVVEPLRRAVLAQVPACRIVRALLPPVLGAVLLALRAVGGDPTGQLASLMESDPR